MENRECPLARKCKICNTQWQVMIACPMPFEDFMAALDCKCPFCSAGTDKILLTNNFAEESFGEPPPEGYPKTVAALVDMIVTPGKVPGAETLEFQSRVNDWMQACFGPEISADSVERNHRFLEEALELVQANGCTRSEAHQLVDYVFDRPMGDLAQEVGGVMVTLAALCTAISRSMRACGETELARIWTKVDTIRAKQAAKPKHSPLPGPSGERILKADIAPVMYALDLDGTGSLHPCSKGDAGAIPLYADVPGLPAGLPNDCDGKEQEAFEAFARDAKMDMTTHPLHWLFLNSKTAAARDAWKAAIRYCRTEVIMAAPLKPSTMPEFLTKPLGEDNAG